MLNKKRFEEWDVVLSEVMFAYNRSVHSTTGVTPHFLMFAVEARVPSEILVGLHEMERTPAAFAFQRYQKLGEAYDAAPESAYKTAKREKIITTWKEFKTNSKREITSAYEGRH